MTEPAGSARCCPTPFFSTHKRKRSNQLYFLPRFQACKRPRDHYKQTFSKVAYKFLYHSGVFFVTTGEEYTPFRPSAAPLSRIPPRLAFRLHTFLPHFEHSVPEIRRASSFLAALLQCLLLPQLGTLRHRAYHCLGPDLPTGSTILGL